MRSDRASVQHEDLSLFDLQNLCCLRASSQGPPEFRCLWVCRELSAVDLQALTRLHEELPCLATIMNGLDIAIGLPLEEALGELFRADLDLCSVTSWHDSDQVSRRSTVAFDAPDQRPQRAVHRRVLV